MATADKEKKAEEEKTRLGMKVVVCSTAPLLGAQEGTVWCFCWKAERMASKYVQYPYDAGTDGEIITIVALRNSIRCGIAHQGVLTYCAVRSVPPILSLPAAGLADDRLALHSEGEAWQRDPSNLLEVQYIMARSRRSEAAILLAPWRRGRVAALE